MCTAAQESRCNITEHYRAENKILSKERVVLRPGSGYNSILKAKTFSQ